MSSSFLSSTHNYSLYAIPVAWVASLAPHFWAISKFDSIQKKGGKKWDNANPRGFLSALGKKDILSPDEQSVVRAEAAQQNGFENLGFFAVSVLAGNYAKIPAYTLNSLAAGYLASRVLYTLLYINISGNKASNLRTGAFLAGIGMCFTLLIKAGNILY